MIGVISGYVLSNEFTRITDFTWDIIVMPVVY